ncbi:MAG: response regulator [Desulfobacterales bacterium]|nr:response regulator [Desulfobacterales bacterium]
MSNPVKQFLILDDEESIRRSIAAYMEDEGHVVFTAESSEEALAIMAANHIHGAVVDIRLPGEDGNAFMLKAVQINPAIQLVVHTGTADYSPPREIRSLGVTADRVMIKPLGDISPLVQVLVSLVDGS